MIDPQVSEFLTTCYGRPCWICGRQGNCKHREPEVEAACVRRITTALAEMWQSSIVSARTAKVAGEDFHRRQNANTANCSGGIAA